MSVYSNKKACGIFILQKISHQKYVKSFVMTKCCGKTINIGDFNDNI